VGGNNLFTVTTFFDTRLQPKYRISICKHIDYKKYIFALQYVDSAIYLKGIKKSCNIFGMLPKYIIRMARDLKIQGTYLFRVIHIVHVNH
jgi:hypothetical protein